MQARPRLRVWLSALALVLALVSALVWPAGPAGAGSPVELARRAGLRVLEGRHLTLLTDRPARDGDGVPDLPGLFDEAFAAWCRHYHVDPAAHADWRAVGCLIVDRERFRAAGLLPVDGVVPDFENGFCAADRFWLVDQSNPDYRRHLLLHEGVHAFTLTLRSAAAPPWYTEGIAELLAMHRLDRAAARGARFVPTPIPERPGDVEQLGRIETLRALSAAGRAPGLEDVFALPPAAHRELSAYAASWAAAAFLAGHPTHRTAFAAAERGPLDRDFTNRLTGTPEWDGPRASRDFAAFLDDLDYGYDFDRMAVDWAPGRPLAEPHTATVAADRGWQNAGSMLAAGQACSFRATGRTTVGRAAGRDLESGPDGITLRWHRGRPVGRLLVAQWVEPADGSLPSFRVLGEGAAGRFTAAAAGPLYCKLNESPGELADNAGGLTVSLTP
ncbi:MAG: hypothetical protein EBZ74_05250 [Planctomycetia bacterium]|nr:hypothetical protein [Planctomycetia bacterium]